MRFSMLETITILSLFGGSFAAVHGEITFDNVAASLQKEPSGIIRFTDDGQVLSLDSAGAVIDSAQLTDNQFEALKVVEAKAKRDGMKERDDGKSSPRDIFRRQRVCQPFRCYFHTDCTDPYPDVCAYCGDNIYGCRPL